MQRRDKELSPEHRKRLRDRFRSMGKKLRDNPELREELRTLAKEDIQAFRRRIRRIHDLTGESVRDGWHHPTRPGQGPGKSGQASRDGAQPGPRRRGGGRGRGRPGNPQITKLEQQSQELAKQYGKAKGRNKEKLDNKLRNTLTEIFDLKVEAQSKQVKRLERQLEKLHERLEKRERNREAMIQKRFSQLTGQEDELPW